MATAPQATLEVREVLAGRPGAVNRIIKRFGKPVVDYATALIPDRSAPFDRMVEDILTDIISQCRAAARSQSDDEVFEFGMEAALRTVRARYAEVLAADARPSKATSSWSFKEVIDRTKMSREDLTAGISEGRIRAVRQNDEMRIKGDAVGLGERKACYSYHVDAGERELLALHYALGFSPKTIAGWAGVTTAQIEEQIGKAANRLGERIASKGGRAAETKDAEMRRYIDGRMDDDETTRFERKILKDKIEQQRLDELRGESLAIKELFDSDHYDLSSVAVNVRARNPHHAISLPPVAALWLQVVGIAFIMLMFHNVGAYIAPPDVRVSAARGEFALPSEGRMSVGDAVETPAGAQALLVLDESNRVLLAPESKLKLLEPRNDARQVLGLHHGEIWGRFTSGGHAFVVEFMGAESDAFEISSSSGADFDLVIGERVNDMLPSNLESQRPRAFAAEFGTDLIAPRAMQTFAGYRLGQGEDSLKQGDKIETIDGVTISNVGELEMAVANIKEEDQVELSVRRGESRVGIALARQSETNRAVLRVFHGSVRVGRAGQDMTLVNARQWALLSDEQPPMVGLRGMEDFRVLRIDATEHFKNRIHWLNNESFPLRAENSVLPVDRALRELARRLEVMRANEIRRDGAREIAKFEMLMRELIADAKDRQDAGAPRETNGANSLSDERLIAAEEEILGAIAHWRRQAASDVHPTLGSAAKGLQSPIARYREDLEAIGSRMTDSLVRQDRVAEIEESIKIQTDELDKLKQSKFYDKAGTKRHELDAKIADLKNVVKGGAQAESRIELLTITLNQLDEELDNERRKLPALRDAVSNAQSKLDEINADIKANVYTPKKLQAATRVVAAAEDALQTAESTVAAKQTALEDAKSAVSSASQTLAEDRHPIANLTSARDEASDALTDALAERAAAQEALDTAQKEVDRIQAELDAMSEDDPERAKKQGELDDAKKVRDDAGTALDDSQSAADAANTAHDAAKEALEEAQSKVADAQASLDKRISEQADAGTALETVKGNRDARQTAVDDAKEAESALMAAKSEREALIVKKGETESELATSEGELKEQQDAVNALDAKAEPERQKLRDELQLVKDAEDAKDQIEDLQTQRGRYQGVSDEIELRIKDRQTLIDDRDALANSDLVTGFADMQNEYTALSRRIGAFEFLQQRALLEDQSFEHEQQAAQDRFKEATAEAQRDAVEVLKKFCPPYVGKPWAPFTGVEGTKLRDAVMASLWKLYYDSGSDGGSDGDELVCYYIAVQSGAPRKAFEELDSRWKAYLTEALGKKEFEALDELSARDLVSDNIEPEPKED